MPDMEKVIRGLECCVGAEMGSCHPKGCPYWEDCGELFEDTLKLLREHVPRVLTLEEANDADIVWMEVPYSDRIRPVRLYQHEHMVTIRMLIANPEDVPTDSYGNDWRCWSARPTKEQREAVKWR